MLVCVLRLINIVVIVLDCLVEKLLLFRGRVKRTETNGIL